MASLSTYAVLHMIFPVERQRGTSPFVLEEYADMIQQADSSSRDDTGVAASDVEKAVPVPKIL